MKKSTWIIIGILAGLILIAGSFTAGAVVGTTFDLIRDWPGFPRTGETFPPSSQIQTEEDSLDPASLEVLFEPF